MNSETRLAMVMNDIRKRIQREGVIVMAANKFPPLSGGFYRLESMSGGGIDWAWFSTIDEAAKPTPDAIEAAIQCGA